MIEFIQSIFTNRRGIAFLIPVVIVGLQRVGVVTTEAEVGTLLDQAAALIAGLLSLWSLARPKVS
jgi:Sec-independent protein secretion pathway component TatC